MALATVLHTLSIDISYTYYSNVAHFIFSQSGSARERSANVEGANQKLQTTVKGTLLLLF
jgi:hypothetical protein